MPLPYATALAVAIVFAVALIIGSVTSHTRLLRTRQAQESKRKKRFRASKEAPPNAFPCSSNPACLYRPLY
jgi:heme exporter protein D